MRLPLGLKKQIAEVLLPDADPVLCASISRVGSTMVRMALARGQRKRRFGPFRSIPRSFLYERAWELKGLHFRPGAIHMTHDFPYDLVAPARLKVVFLYGRPSDTILSLIRRRNELGPEWMDRHFAHMHAEGDYNEIIQRDVLRIGEQIQAWRAAHHVNVLGLRYSGLWENLDRLSEFVGFQVDLPARVERNFRNVDPVLASMVRENYRELDLLEAQLPDYFFTQPATGALNGGLAKSASCHA